MFTLKPISALSPKKIPQYFEELANYTYIPETKEEILSIDYFNLKALMYTNIPFFNAAISQLDEEVAKPTSTSMTLASTFLRLAMKLICEACAKHGSYLA